jgi:hypothetical protein
MLTCFAGAPLCKYAKFRNLEFEGTVSISYRRLEENIEKSQMILLREFVF